MCLSLSRCLYVSVYACVCMAMFVCVCQIKQLCMAEVEASRHDDLGDQGQVIECLKQNLLLHQQQTHNLNTMCIQVCLVSNGHCCLSVCLLCCEVSLCRLIDRQTTGIGLDELGTNVSDLLVRDSSLSRL